jgi:polar amino acid transport system substrate-binding protein
MTWDWQGGSMKRVWSGVALLLLVTAHGLASVSAETAPLVVAVGEYTPFFSDNLPDNGPLSTVVQTAFARQGIASKVVFYPWRRALDMARKGVAVSPGWTNTEERRLDFLFSDPFYVTTDALFFRAGTFPPIAGLDDLSGLKVGIISGYSYGSEFDAAVQSKLFVVDEAPDAEANLKKLLGNRVDAIILNRAFGMHLLTTLTQEQSQRITVSPQKFNSKPWSVAVGRATPNAQAIIDAFNAGLAAIRKDGTLDSIIKSLKTAIP